MITISGQPSVEADGRFKYNLEANSNDELPVKEFHGHKIANASNVLIIDTADVKFYDQDSESWV